MKWIPREGAIKIKERQGDWESEDRHLRGVWNDIGNKVKSAIGIFELLG